MNEPITAFVGLDAHAESTAIGVAELGRAPPRFVGAVGAKFAELTKALGKLGKPSCLLIVYEAGPCGYALARELVSAGYRCEASNSKHCCCVRDAAIWVRAPGLRLTSATLPRCPSHTAPRTSRSWSIGQHVAVGP
jgi:hypothetical protein